MASTSNAGPGVSVGSTRDDETMKILIASDIHLGFCENDLIRGEPIPILMIHS